MALEQFFGRIVDMQPRTDGDNLAAAAAVGATTLYVGDTSDFDELGGQVLVGGDVYDYDEVDHDAATIHLTTALTVASAIGDPVDSFDTELGQTVVEYVANVLLDDQDPDDQPIEVTVQHGLVNYIDESIRAAAAESVTLIRDGDDDMVIWQIDGKLAVDIATEDAVASAAEAFDLAESALTATQIAIAISDGRIDSYYQTSAPWANGSTAHDDDLGDLWVDTDSGTPNLAYRWLGAANRNWVLIEDASIVAALNAAESAQTTADGKITHFVGPTAPVAEGYGDIWTNTAQDNTKYYWTGSTWAALVLGDDGIAAELIGKILTGALIRSSSSPTQGIKLSNTFLAYTAAGALSVRIDANGVLETFVNYVYFHDGAYIEDFLTLDGTMTARALDIGGAAFPGGGSTIAGGLTVKNGLAVTSGDVVASNQLKGNDLYATGALTTTDAANCNMNPTTGRIRVSTSTRRHKHILGEFDLDLDAVRAFRTVTYTSTLEDDDPETVHVGKIAEEADEAGLPFTWRDADGEIGGFHYDRFAAAAVTALARENAALREQMAALAERLDQAGL